MALGWPVAAFGDEPTTLSHRILYTPQAAELTLEHTARLIAEGAEPDRIDCVIVMTERPPQDIVTHMEDIARKIRDDISAEAARALGREIPVEVAVHYEDTGPRLLGQGYTLSNSTPISGGGRTVRLDLYQRIGYATGSDYGEARAAIRLRSTLCLGGSSYDAARARWVKRDAATVFESEPAPGFNALRQFRLMRSTSGGAVTGGALALLAMVSHGTVEGNRVAHQRLRVMVRRKSGSEHTFIIVDRGEAGVC